MNAKAVIIAVRGMFDEAAAKDLMPGIFHSLLSMYSIVIGIVNSIDVREVEKVMVEHNLKVIWGKLERNVPVISAIRALVANSAFKVGNFLRLHPLVNFK
jgi:hypothetical protein